MKKRILLGLCLLAPCCQGVGAREALEALPVLTINWRNWSEEMAAIRPKQGYLQISGFHQIEGRVELAPLPSQSSLDRELQYGPLSLYPFADGQNPKRGFVIPPSVVLTLKRKVGNNWVAVPAKMRLLGGSDFLLELPYPEPVRKRRLKAYVSEFIQELPEPKPKPGSKEYDELTQSMTLYFGDQIVDNQPGEYEVTATYTSRGKRNWHGTVKSKPIKIRVLDSTRKPRAAGLKYLGSL